MDEQLRQEIVDDEHLKLLRLGFFISAGISTLAALFVLLYTSFIFFIFAQVAKQSSETAPPAFVGKIIGVLGVGFALALFTVAILQCVTAQRLKQRRSRIFCMVIAAITCVHIPYGTLLGVATFIVLGRPTTERLFQGPQGADEVRGATRAADTSAS